MARLRKVYQGNVPTTTLASSITAGSTTVQLNSGTGWPSTGPFVIAVDWGTSLEEKILVASRSGNILTVTSRAYDGTSAQSHTAGSTCLIKHVLDAETLDGANELAALMTTKGDLITTNGSTPQRLGAGIAGQVLAAVPSAGTGMAWAASWTVCTSGARPGSPAAGMGIFETDTSKAYVYNGTGWQILQADVQLFTANGTWTKPVVGPNATTEVQAVGGAGSGGGGSMGAAGTLRPGGGGGGAGARASALYRTADLTATVSVTVGQGGAAVASAAVNGNGPNGNPGTATTFGAFLTALGGAAGIGGVAGGTGSAGGLAGGQLVSGATGPGNGGASVTGAAAANGVAAILSGGGGGGAGGGSIDAANTQQAGGTGGNRAQDNTGGGTNAVAALASTTGATLGGAGGGTTTGGNANANANGALYGGGGGGGTGALTGFPTGNSGSGANGVLLAITYP
jgi:hypothetical protein